jgi:hypothetical protein
VATEPQDKIWKGKGWSDGQKVSQMPQPDGSTAEATAAYQYAYNPSSGAFSPLQVDPASGGLMVFYGGGAAPPAAPALPPQPNTEPLDKHWKGKAWSDGIPVTRVPQADGTVSEAQAALGYAWNANTGTYQKVPVDPTTGALQVAIVGGTGASTQIGQAGCVYVAATGADANDGKSPATPKLTIASAYAALPAGGGKIIVGAGSYLFTAPLNITKPNVSIEASGPVTFTRSAAFIFLVLQTGSDGFACRGITFDGASATAWAIQIQTSTRITVQECTFINIPAGQVGIAISGPASNIRIQRCTMQILGLGVNIAPQVNPGNDISDVLVESCNFDYANGIGVNVASVGTTAGPRNIRIMGNHFRGTARGVSLSSGVGFYQVQEVVISDNTFVSVDPGSGGIGMISLTRAIDVTVGNNTVDCGGTSVLLRAIEIISCDRITCRGNVITNTALLTTGIALRDSRACAVVGNTINGFNPGGAGRNTYQGIYMVAAAAGEHCDDNVIANNTIMFPSSGAGCGLYAPCSNATATLNRNLVACNVIRGNGAATDDGVRFDLVTGAIDSCLAVWNDISNVANLISVGGAPTNLQVNFPLSFANVAALPNTTSAPTTNAPSGGYLYAEAGALKWRGSAGTITVLAPA